MYEFPTKVAILVRGSEFAVVKECKSIYFRTNVDEFQAKVMVLARWSHIFVVKECKSIYFSKEAY